MKKVNIPCKFNKQYALYAVLALLVVWCAVLCYRVRKADLKVENAKYVYVYDVNALVKNYPALVTLQQNYKTQLNALVKQAEEAQQKASKVEDKKAKEEVSKAYLASVAEKRDALVADYNKNLSILTAKVNKALEKVTIERKLPAVFNSSVIAVRTPYVVDITPDVLNNLK